MNDFIFKASYWQGAGKTIQSGALYIKDAVIWSGHQIYQISETAARAAYPVISTAAATGKEFLSMLADFFKTPAGVAFISLTAGIGIAAALWSMADHNPDVQNNESAKTALKAAAGATLVLTGALWATGLIL